MKKSDWWRFVANQNYTESQKNRNSWEWFVATLMVVTFLAQTLSFPCDPKPTGQNDQFNETRQMKILQKHILNFTASQPHQIAHHHILQTIASRIKSHTFRRADHAHIPSPIAMLWTGCTRAYVLKKPVSCTVSRDYGVFILFSCHTVSSNLCKKCVTVYIK